MKLKQAEEELEMEVGAYVIVGMMWIGFIVLAVGVIYLITIL